MSDRRSRFRMVLWILLVVSVGALLFAAEPGEGGIYPPCPFFSITGMHCPGCGTLRALNRLLHADPAGAISMNALTVLFVPFVLYYFANLAWVSRGLRPLPGAAALSKAGWWVIALLLIFAVLRNLPFEPFSRLAPG